MAADYNVRELDGYSRDAIVCLMEDMTVIHFLAEASGALTELDRVKLSGKIPGNNGIITWVGSVLAIITGRGSSFLLVKYLEQ